MQLFLQISSWSLDFSPRLSLLSFDTLLHFLGHLLLVGIRFELATVVAVSVRNWLPLLPIGLRRGSLAVASVFNVLFAAMDLACQLDEFLYAKLDRYDSKAAP